MLMTLMVMLAVSVLGIAMITVATMEFKTGHYDFEAEQAQQAADAGIDWSMENIYLELIKEQYGNMKILPDLLPWGNDRISFTVGGKTCTANIGNVMKKEQTMLEDRNTCIYEFTSEGRYEGASKSVKVEVVYSYNGGYDYIGNNGYVVFVPRTDIERGKIKSYRTI